MADIFSEVREDLDFSYTDISQNQLNTALSTIEDKISSIQVEIASLESRIAAEIARLAREREEQRKG